MKVTFVGQWKFPAEVLRLFNIHLPCGEVPTFAVAPGESLKDKFTACLKRFAAKEAA